MKLLISLFCLFISTSLFASNSFKLQKIMDDQGVIWAFEFLDSDRILFTERSGNLKLFNNKTKKVTKITGLPKIHVSGQGGLLDVIADSQFLKNKVIYLTYSLKQESGSTTAVFKAELEKNKLKDGKTIFVATTESSRSIHYGSRIRESKDGFLFLSVGDRGKRHQSQKLSNHHGKILRITKDGKAAPGNPFIKTKGALPEIWSYGHRNPQGMDYIKSKDELWVNEHGPRGGDEINLSIPGKNYGWPIITYGKEYWGPSIGDGTHKKGMEQPLYQFTPSIAPSGLVLYSGKLIPEWKGNFISGALKLAHLNRVYKSGNQWKEDRPTKIEEMSERIRSVKEDTDGAIFFSTDSGKLFRLSSK